MLLLLGLVATQVVAASPGAKNPLAGTRTGFTENTEQATGQHGKPPPDVKFRYAVYRPDLAWQTGGPPCNANPALANDTAICGAGKVELNATGAIHYRWYATPTEPVPLDTNQAYTFFLAETDTFYVAGFDGVCESARDTVIVTVHPLPSPTITGRDKVCENGTYSYRAGKNAGSAYRWVVSGGIVINGALTDVVTVKWSASGSGSLHFTETNALGCSESLLFPVAINPLPSASWKATYLGGRDYAFKAGDSTQWDYFWQFGDGGTSDTGYHVGNTYVRDSIYIVSLRVTTGAGCTSTDSDTLRVRLTAIAPDNEPVASLRFWPNPFRESATLSYSLPKTAHVKVQICDAQGRLLAQPFDGRSEAGENICVIDGEKLGLAPGVYLLKIWVDGVAESRLMMRN